MSNNSTRDFESNFKARAISDVIEPIGLSCTKCWDSGLVWVDIDGYSAWAYCRCFNGTQKSIGKLWALPIFDYEMERLFKAKAFPVKAFKPSSFKSFENGLNSKVNDFKKSIRESEKFWQNQK